MGLPSLSGDFVAMLFRICLRALQLIMALVVLGMYGTDLNEARKQGKPGNIKWVSFRRSSSGHSHSLF
jgi:hypothetical protein